MWKDSLKIGIEEVDAQHKELFKRVNSFVGIVLGNTKIEEKEKKIEETLDFLSEYVILHFQAEEKIQKENNYPGYKEHCKIHNNFIKEVVDFKKEFKENGFNQSMIYKFSGKMVSWLINHVANEDQKIKNYLVNVKEDKKENDISNGYLELIVESTKKIMNSMLQLEIEKTIELLILEEEYSKSEIRISINLIGDIEGEILYSFSKDMSLKILEKMAGMKMEEVDEFVTSAISELVNIITATISGELLKLGYLCDITAPKVIIGKGRNEILKKEKTIDTILDTEIGSFDFRFDLLKK